MGPPPRHREEKKAETNTAPPPASDRGAVHVSDEHVELQGEEKGSCLAFCSAERCDCYLKVLLHPDLEDFVGLEDPFKDHELRDLAKNYLSDPNNQSMIDEIIDFFKNDEPFRMECPNNMETVKWYRISSIILKASSQYFHEFFERSNEQEENVLTVGIKESEEPAFRKLLEFMHGMSTPSTTDPLKLSATINVAEKFGIPLWAKKCKEELVNRFKSLQHPEIMSLPLAAVMEILKSDDLEVQSEDDVYKFTIEWALRNYPIKQQRHQVMESELSPLIRFHYMSYGMLVHCKANYDEFFSRNFIREAVRTAMYAKIKAPERNFIERVYKHKPLMVSEVFQPRRSCTIWLTFTRNECSRLMLSSPARSTDFKFHNGRFFIQVVTAKARCFSLDVKIGHLPSHDYFLCTAAVKAKGDSEYVGTHSWVFQACLQYLDSYKDLFDMPLSEFIRDDCPYFDDGKLYLQVKIEAIERPRLMLRLK